MLITLVIVVSLVALALGMNLLVRNTVTQETLLQTVGDVPMQARSLASAGINQYVYNVNTGLNNTTTSSSVTSCTNTAGCTSGDATTGANFPVPLLQNPNFTGAYTVKLLSGTATTGTVLSTGTVSGTNVAHSRTVKVSIELISNLWRVQIPTRKESE